MKGLTHTFFEFTFPPTESPLWKDSVPRWYQLDAYAYGLAEGAYRWRGNSNRPDMIILASPEGSNDTDRAFMDSGAVNPSKFAHTLPNIRCSPFCQVMEWSGPVLCLQRDPQTQILGLIEGLELDQRRFPRVWILSVIRHEFQYKVHCFEVSQSPSPLTMQRRLEKTVVKLSNDDELMGWFEKSLASNDGASFIFGNYEIKKESFA